MCEFVMSSSGSDESIAFSTFEDALSDWSPLQNIPIESPKWSRSILDLFEDCSGADSNSCVQIGEPQDPEQNNSIPNNDGIAISTTALEALYERYVLSDTPDANEESCSSSLSDSSTFCLEEAMVEPSMPAEAVGDELPNLCVLEKATCIEDLKACSSTVSNCDHKEKDNKCIDNDSSFKKGEKDCLESTPFVENVSETQHSSKSNTQTSDKWNVEQYTPSQLSDSLMDSGFDDIEDMLDASQASEVPERHRQLQDRIVDLLHQIEQTISEGVPLSVRKKPTWQSCSMESGILQSNSLSQGDKIIKPIDCRRLQLMVRLLASIYQLLATRTSCTKRELYYLHLDLAQSPCYTYAALDDVCALLDADAWELNVFNTSKGLVSGPLLIKLACGRTVDCNARWGTSVPLDVGSVVELQLSAALVLVVEKDTVFKRLLEDGIMEKFCNRLLLITGKGYPDISTRLLLKKISICTNVPICGLMDADPHGIEIFCVYKFGSLAMAYQQQSLAVPIMRWIGLFPSDIELLGLRGVPLRENELKKIEHIVKRPYTEGIFERELLFLRQLATKAEIESLYHIASDFMTTVYLPQKFKELRLNV
ncbi:meiotic recombination protein SPO11 [Anopheles ziemanni]|uniref:meiotic recombination protein SPO11 n=1 Tax=Anopheles coustani TaxID=139045 RepID=UPI00265A027B|nr:meiotic recombination protein SPO11 [Anopheles coustani]XP_058169985.1 meiotic recombination protein SPO11 [Anopheles ziemanni]